jgi:F-type H+-transporting ATPase subunit epsilon
MADTLKLEVVTPDGTAYSQDVEMVTMEAVEGQIGILPFHTRLITQIVPGEMIVLKDGHEDLLAVGEGIVMVTDTSVSVLTDMAIAADKIDEAKV